MQRAKGKQEHPTPLATWGKKYYCKSQPMSIRNNLLDNSTHKQCQQMPKVIHPTACLRPPYLLMFEILFIKKEMFEAEVNLRGVEIRFFFLHEGLGDSFFKIWMSILYFFTCKEKRTRRQIKSNKQTLKYTRIWCWMQTILSPNYRDTHADRRS